MPRNQGFISVFALIFMSVILLFSLFLLNISKLEYCISNFSEDKVQAYYSAESKIHLVLKSEKYYNQLLLGLEKYLKGGHIPECKIIVDGDDLIEDDLNSKVDAEYIRENNRLLCILTTSSSCNKISRILKSKLNVINDFYELKFPILREDIIESNRVSGYVKYIDQIQEEIEIPDETDKIIGVDATSYEKINIITGLDNKITIEFFRNEIEKPVKTEKLSGEKIFFMAKNEGESPININLFSELDLEEIALEGAFYIEGNFKVYNDMNFKGLLIINNGAIEVNSSAELKIDGIVLLKNYLGMDIEKQNNIMVNYAKEIIEQNGAYIPGFIDIKVHYIKVK